MTDLQKLTVPIGADTGEFSREMDKVQETVKKSNNSFSENMKTMGGKLDTLSKEVTGFSVAELATVGAATKLLQEGVKFAKDSISEYSGYVDQISKMAAYTSTSTEEMSKLYQMTDDLRIPVGDLEMALKTMTDKGFAPSIDSIKEMSDKYIALQDPLLQAQFLTENFGRAGQEMARLMELGSTAIDENAAAISDWMIVTGESEQVILDYLATQDTWEEGLQRVKFEFAQNVTPTITKFMDAILKSNDTLQDADNAWWRWIPQVRAVETLFTSIKGLLDSFSGKLKDNTKDVIDQTNAANDLKNSWSGVNSELNIYSNNTTRGNLRDRPNYGNMYSNQQTTNHATGGSFVIPEGFQNDSFYLGAGHFAQSGEIVNITPKNQIKDSIETNNSEIKSLLQQIANKPTLTKNDLILANRELINKNFA